MQERENNNNRDDWDISKGDYKRSNDYSKGQNQIRKRAKFVKRTILVASISLSFIIFIIVLSLLTKVTSLK